MVVCGWGDGRCARRRSIHLHGTRRASWINMARFFISCLLVALRMETARSTAKFSAATMAVLICVICVWFQAELAQAGEIADGAAISGNRSPCLEVNAEGFIRLIDLPATAFPFHFVPVQGRDLVDFVVVVRCKTVQGFSSWSRAIAGQTPRIEGDYTVFSLGNRTADLFHSPRRDVFCDAEWKGQMKGFPRGCKIEVPLCRSKHALDTVQLIAELEFNIGDLPEIDLIETTSLAAAREKLRAEGIPIRCIST